MEDHTAKSYLKLLLWTLLIIAVTIPFADLGFEPRRRIRWIPAIAGRRNLIDAVLNLALYVPFGYWMCARDAGRAFSARAVARAVAAAFCLSLLAETSQVFSRSRFPSITDLLTNTAGAWLGAVWASTRAAKM